MTAHMLIASFHLSFPGERGKNREKVDSYIYYPFFLVYFLFPIGGVSTHLNSLTSSP